MESREMLHPLLHPVGPLPPRVYWTRRLLLLGALVVVIIAVAVACSGGGGPTAPRAAATATTSPAPSVTPTPGCAKADLTVTAATDAARYSPAALPRLIMTIRNDGSAPCRFVDSARTRSWSIYSGTDQIWTDAGCGAASPRLTRTLAVHGTLRHALFWNRHRSGPKCSDSTATADPGTYRLYVTVRGQRSAPAVFHLTG